MSARQPHQPTLSQWLSAEPFTLAMSSGFFGFFAHCGVLAALEENGIKPAKISGSSAGALVGGLWASGLDAHYIRDVLLKLRRHDFWDPTIGLGLLKGKMFDSILKDHLPVLKIEQCRVPLGISVFDIYDRRTKIVDGGELAPAIRASCAVPFLFHPVRLGSRLCLDGGIMDRPGMSGLQDGERVFYHHLLPSSFWRRKNAPTSQIPNRLNMKSLAIKDLPQVNPFALDRGKLAFEQARATMQGLLNE